MHSYKKVVMVLILISLFSVTLFSAEIKPIAKFEFKQAEYGQGEKVEVVDQSYSPDGTKIVRKEWMIIVSGSKIQSINLDTVLKSAHTGENEIFLRVRNSKGVWSDWTSRKVKLDIPEPIKITNFGLEKSTYAIGEKLQFEYTYSNPDELDVSSQRWKYRNVSTNGTTISGKPKYFSKEGKYEIALEVQDELGNWSNKMVCTVSVSNEKVERDGYYLFYKGRQGDLLEGYIDKDYNTFNETVDSEYVDTPGSLIMSNSPETIPSSGILYQDTVKGEGKLLVHHANGTQNEKKLLVLVKAKEDTVLEVSNMAIEGPHRNILSTGQKAVYNYFKGSTKQTYKLKAGELTCIYSSSKQKAWKNGEVISGMFDFNSDKEVTFQVVALDSLSPMQNVSKLNPLPDDGIHIRGTYGAIERTYTVNISKLEEPAKLVIGKLQEEWLEGRDALTGKTVYNKGNYGLPIVIKVKSDEDMGIIINARGGNYLGALKWNNTKVFNVPNEDILNTQKLAALVGMVQANVQNEFTYMLPNGSAAPALFGFVPSHLWKD